MGTAWVPGTPSSRQPLILGTPHTRMRAEHRTLDAHPPAPPPLQRRVPIPWGRLCGCPPEHFLSPKPHPPPPTPGSHLNTQERSRVGLSSPAIIKDSPFRAPSVLGGESRREGRKEKTLKGKREEGVGEKKGRGKTKAEMTRREALQPLELWGGGGGDPFLPPFKNASDSCGKGERGLRGRRERGEKGMEPQHRASFGPNRRGCRSAPELRPTPAVIISSSKRCHPTSLIPPPGTKATGGGSTAPPGGQRGRWVPL